MAAAWFRSLQGRVAPRSAAVATWGGGRELPGLWRAPPQGRRLLREAEVALRKSEGFLSPRGLCRERRGFSTSSSDAGETAAPKKSLSLVQIRQKCQEHPDFFVHVGNIIVLLAINQTDMLYLRLFMGTSSAFQIVYNLLQPVPLVAPAAWAFFFICCHAYYILLLLKERQPVVLSPDHEEAYEMAFMRFGFTPRQFCDVMEHAGAQWCAFQRGAWLHKRGELFTEISFLLEGEVKMVGDGGDDMKVFKPGKGAWLGEIFDPNMQDADAVDEHLREMSWQCVSERCRTLTLSCRELRECVSGNPRLREAATRMQADDLWAKVRMGREESRRNAYFRMVEVAVSDGTVDARTRELLNAWRRKHGILDEVHAASLREFGWSVEQFAAGQRLTGAPTPSSLWFGDGPAVSSTSVMRSD